MRRIFGNHEKEYLVWLKANPGGFVVNTRRRPDPDYMVLHRATCWTINRYTTMAKPGGFTERDFIKACSNSLNELRDWVRRNGRSNGSFSKECSICGK